MISYDIAIFLLKTKITFSVFLSQTMAFGRNSTSNQTFVVNKGNDVYQNINTITIKEQNINYTDDHDKPNLCSKNNTMDENKLNKQDNDDIKTYNFDVSWIPITTIKIIYLQTNKDFYKNEEFYNLIPHSSIIALPKNIDNPLHYYPKLIKECINQNLKISKGFYIFMDNAQEIMQNNNMIKQNTLFYCIRFAHREDNAIFHASYKEQLNAIFYCKKISSKKIKSYISLDGYNFRTQQFAFSNNINITNNNEHKEDDASIILDKPTRQNPPKSPEDAIKQYNLKNRKRLRWTSLCKHSPCNYGSNCHFVHGFNGERVRCKNEAKHGQCFYVNCSFLHGISDDEYERCRNTNDHRILKHTYKH